MKRISFLIALLGLVFCAQHKCSIVWLALYYGGQAKVVELPASFEDEVCALASDVGEEWVDVTPARAGDLFTTIGTFSVRTLNGKTEYYDLYDWSPEVVSAWKWEVFGLTTSIPVPPLVQMGHPFVSNGHFTCPE